MSCMDAPQVLLGSWQGTPVAVKVLKDFAQAGDAAKAEFLKEAAMLSSLHHPHILNFFGACVTASSVRWRRAISGMINIVTFLLILL